MFEPIQELDKDTALVVHEKDGRRLLSVKQIDYCHSLKDGTSLDVFEELKKEMLESVDYEQDDEVYLYDTGYSMLFLALETPGSAVRKKLMEKYFRAGQAGIETRLARIEKILSW